MSNPGAPSDIWYHFERSEMDKRAKCRYCSAKISFSHGTTSNLLRHLTKKHPTVEVKRSRRAQLSFQFSRCRSSSSDSAHQTPNDESQHESESEVAGIISPSLGNVGQGSLTHTSPSTSTPVACGASISPLAVYSSSGKKASAKMTSFVEIIKPIPIHKSRQIDIQLLKMVCTEYQPLSIVEDKEFVKLLKLLNPNYNVPSRKTLSNSLLPAIHMELKTKIMSMLEEAKAVSITSDGWTNVNTVSFYAVTAHFLNKKTELQSVLLECSEFSGRHTSSNISSWLNGVLRHYNIHAKTCAVVTDNAANIKAAVNEAGLKHLACFAHTLNLIVQGAIDVHIQTVVNKIKIVVQFFKQSSNATSKLLDMQSNLNVPVLKLKQDVPTRWNSTYDMLDRILKTREAVISVLALLNPRLNNVSETEWKIIDESVKMLKVFYEVTEEISSEKAVSLPQTCIFVRGIMANINYVIQNQDCCTQPEVIALGQCLLDGLTKRFGGRDRNELIGQSVFLDPRFKKQGFWDDGTYQEIYKGVLRRVKQSSDSAPVEVSTNVSNITTPSSSAWDLFDKKVENIINITDPSALAIVEVDKFLSEPLLNRRSDPLIWWESRKNIYPNLYKLVLKRMCIPATSVPCERIFSKAGQIYTLKRSRLTSKKLDQMLFINVNGDFI